MRCSGIFPQDIGYKQCRKITVAPLTGCTRSTTTDIYFATYTSYVAPEQYMANAGICTCTFLVLLELGKDVLWANQKGGTQVSSPAAFTIV